MDRIREYWNRGKKEKVIVSVVAGIILFIIYKIFKGIFSGQKNNIELSSTDQGETPKASGLIYGSTGTNTDVGYLNEETFTNINKNFEVLESNLSDLFTLQEMTVADLDTVKTDFNTKVDSITASQNKSEDFTDRLYDWADQVTKFKQMYNSASNDDERRAASQGASRVRQIASTYAKKNGLTINEVYYPNELLQGGGYTELIIEGISI